MFFGNIFIILAKRSSFWSKIAANENILFFLSCMKGIATLTITFSNESSQDLDNSLFEEVQRISQVIQKDRMFYRKHFFISQVWWNTFDLVLRNESISVLKFEWIRVQGFEVSWFNEKGWLKVKGKVNAIFLQAAQWLTSINEVDAKRIKGPPLIHQVYTISVL